MGGAELRADVVVVSASAYGSPAILLRSAIPEIPAANTNLTTVALAERAAEWL